MAEAILFPREVEDRDTALALVACTLDSICTLAECATDGASLGRKAEEVIQGLALLARAAARDLDALEQLLRDDRTDPAGWSCGRHLRRAAELGMDSLMGVRS